MSDFVTKTTEREKKGMQLSAIVTVVKMFQMNFLTFRAFCLEKKKKYKNNNKNVFMHNDVIENNSSHAVYFLVLRYILG